MNKIQIIHNAKAGHGEFSKETLIALLEEEGYECRYTSTKEDFDKVWNESEFVVVGGGDGTIRKVVKSFLERKRIQKIWPLAILPLGSANNIAKSLGFDNDPKKVITSWKKATIQPYDIGIVHGVPDYEFFMESFGYGLFPTLMVEIKEKKQGEKETPKDKTVKALNHLLKLVLEAEPVQCDLYVDGKEYSGRYLLVEVMNIKSLGPNLQLSARSQTEDGKFDVVLVSEEHRQQLADYIAGKIEGKEKGCAFTTMRAKTVEIRWAGTLAHVDDKAVELKRNTKVQLEMNQGVLRFLVP